MNTFPKTIICETSTLLSRNMDFRFGPKQEVIENRIDFLEQFGIPYQEHIAMRCDHGDIISLVDEKNPECGARTQDEQIHSEVLVTQKKHLALMLFTADCLPMSLYDPVTQTIALAHVSRKTLVDKLPQKTVGFLRRQCDVAPQDLIINIGPHIQKQTYAFVLPLPDTPLELNGFIEERDGHAYIDLAGSAVRQLTTAGIQKENITVSSEDTGDTEKYFSYYLMKRDGNQQEARMATILMMR